MKTSVIREKLSAYPISDISKRHRFNLRSDAKVGLLSFLGSFFLSLSQDHSLRNWASHLSDLLPSGVGLSKAGLQKRLGSRQLASVKAFLESAMNHRLSPLLAKQQSKGLLSSFARVLVEDSVCVKLNSALFSVFPGSHSKTGQAATARIQLCLELKSLHYERFSLSSYRKNDQGYSGRILELVQAGELVIRDLGYWSLKVFAKISQAQAFFLTRYRASTTLYDQKGERIDLSALLSGIERKGGNFCDQWVYVGQKERVKARLVALKCPDEVAEQRIRKAKKDRNNRVNHSAEYYQQLRWTILLTNVDREVWKASDLMSVYGFRWHIEMIFKVWKSALGLQTLMTQAQIKKPIHAQLFFYLFLCYLTVCYLPYYTFYLAHIYARHNRILSPFGFAKVLKKHFVPIIHTQLQNPIDPTEWEDILLREALYEKRAKRANQLEMIFQIKEAKAFVMVHPTSK